MGFSKTLVDGPLGSVIVNENGGNLSIVAKGNISVGGGQAAGSVSGQVSAEIDIPGAQLVQLAFEYIEAHSPAGVVFIEKEVQAAALAALTSL